MRDMAILRTLIACYAVIFVASLGGSAQDLESDIIRILRSNRMYLVDLRNSGYTLAFPRERTGPVNYNADYLFHS